MGPHPALARADADGLVSGVLTNAVSRKRAVIQGLKYMPSHEWAKVEGDVAVVGITDHAQVRSGWAPLRARSPRMRARAIERRVDRWRRGPETNE